MGFTQLGPAKEKVFQVPRAADRVGDADDSQSGAMLAYITVMRVDETFPVDNQPLNVGSGEDYGSQVYKDFVVDKFEVPLKTQTY